MMNFDSMDITMAKEDRSKFFTPQRSVSRLKKTTPRVGRPVKNKMIQQRQIAK